MSLTSKQEVLDFWAKNESTDAKAERRENEALRKDIRTAQEYIMDALARYRKKKLNAQSKAAANSEDVFAELDDYQSVEDIRDAYGWELISENEMNRLMNLWQLRKEAKAKSGVYRDRITEMLETAFNSIFDRYGGPVLEYDEKISLMHKEAEHIARANFENDVRRERESVESIKEPI
jgi:hypothetical protein